MQHAGVVVVGSGQGGFQVAASLREQAYQAPITLVGEEPGLPYQRPPLSKAYLSGKAPPAQIELRPASFYVERNITVMAPQRAYQHLVLATGARARMPAVPGAGLKGIVSLRTRADAEALFALLRGSQRLAIVGAGFIGLEVASVARDMGLDVHVVEFADRVLQRAVSTPTAAYLADALTRRGVQFSFGSGAMEFNASRGEVTGVVTTRGDTIPADLVVVGVGVEPNDELARAAGLPVQNGIIVDAHLLTADPLISAIGDCARYPADYCALPVRLESVQNAVDQARCVAARIAGKAEPYRKVPWFWSDQGDNRLQIAGLAEHSDEAVLRGDPACGRFSVFRFRAGRLMAVESVNQAADHMTARKLLAQCTPLTPAQARDPCVKLTALAALPVNASKETA